MTAIPDLYDLFAEAAGKLVKSARTLRLRAAALLDLADAWPELRVQCLLLADDYRATAERVEMVSRRVPS